MCRIYFETDFAQKLLVDFTNIYKESASLRQPASAD